MGKVYKLIVKEWEESALRDGGILVDFECRCPRCDYIDQEFVRKSEIKNGIASVGCACCDCAIDVYLGNTEPEYEDCKDDEASKTEQLLDAACALWDYMGDNFDEDDVASVIEEFEFDKSRLNITKMQAASEEELSGLCSDLVYMVLNGFISGDFETMHEILVNELDIDYEFANEWLDF